jgi:ABC-type lipoprotein export system ATPase subunit
MSFERGSEWRKWDLHVHTKNTNKNDQFKSPTFEDFCNEMFKKVLENEIAVIGITDYFSIENYKKVGEFIKNNLPRSINKLIAKLKKIKWLSETQELTLKDFQYQFNEFCKKSDFTDNEIEKIKKITLIPNVELRMLPSTGSGRLINIHCLFNPNYISKLDNDFFSAIEFSHGARKYRMNKDDLINLGKAMRETDNELAYKKGIDNFVVSHSDLQKILAENAELRINTIIVTSNKSTDGASGTQEHFKVFENEQNSSLDATRQAIYKLTDMIFSSNKSDIEYFLGNKKDSKEEVIKKCGSLKPCIHGSDAHTESKLFIPDNNRHCWIKANPTFEGLKQVIYEPSRVYIGGNRPQSALHKLEEVLFNFNENTLWDNDKFCFANFNEPLKFSPYLSCIIGGRGSGKSTLLNLIANNKKLFPKLNIASKVKFIPDVIDNIEYLAQNEIEEFAKDSTKFTKAIFERLDKKSNFELSKTEAEITKTLGIFDKQINLLKSRVNNHLELRRKKNELKKLENIIKTFNDKQYSDNKEKLQNIQKELVVLENSRTLYKQLFAEINDLIAKSSKILEPKNVFDEYYNEYVVDLEALSQKYKTKDYLEVKEKQSNLQLNSKAIQKEISDYFKTKNMTEDNIKDAQNAITNIESIRNDIAKLKVEIVATKKQINKFELTSLDLEITGFNDKLKQYLNTINKSFSDIAIKNSSEVKIIKVQYQLPNEQEDSIVEEFITHLSKDIVKDINRTTFKNYLKDVSITDVIKIKKASEFIDKIKTQKSRTYNALDEIFNSEVNFSIYKLLIQKHLRNIEKYKILKVFYDDKELEKSSFGQRCTAVIIILLSLDNNPIIIDEPEAHLDSSLIANYLVELIKEQKEQRQIIFATHNANFVLNADAELIIKLENTDGITSSVSFAIEDLNHREDLLKLEGGKEAFKKRERKYNI